jgi:hypothetical protein
VRCATDAPFEARQQRQPAGAQGEATPLPDGHAIAQQHGGERRIQEVVMLLDSQRPHHTHAVGQAFEVVGDDEVVAVVEQHGEQAVQRKRAVDDGKRR